ncbi:MAG: hypothetical protein HZC11_08025 [Nitrospirae bacterium]|nr:hypothetical protein [Nitrospirota bacterium]
MDKKIKKLIVFPVILIIILMVIANSVNLKSKLFYLLLKGELSESEMQILQGVKQLPVQSTPSDIRIKQQQRVHIVKELGSPIDFKPPAPAGVPFPPVSLEELAPKTGGKDMLNLIVVSDKIRMAVIKGIVVKEGESINGITIARIEPDRVLLKNKTSQWLYMEKIK